MQFKKIPIVICLTWATNSFIVKYICFGFFLVTSFFYIQSTSLYNVMFTNLCYLNTLFMICKYIKQTHWYYNPRTCTRKFTRWAL